MSQERAKEIVGSLKELALALGIKEPGYMETWEDAIAKAIAEPPATAIRSNSHD